MQKYIDTDYAKRQANLYFGNIHDAVLFGKFMDNMPAADVKPIAYTCWEPTVSGDITCGFCKAHSKYHYRFCPNCGVKVYGAKICSNNAVSAAPVIRYKYVDADYAKGQTESYFGNSNDAAQFARMYIDSIPAADVEPIVHSKWITVNGNTTCSYCNMTVQGHYNYCPFCGALIDKEDDKCIFQTFKNLLKRIKTKFSVFGCTKNIHTLRNRK